MTKKSPLYTRTGDLGTTSLIGGTRVKKNDIRVNAYGTTDELNSYIGLLISFCNNDGYMAQTSFLSWLQNKLFDLGAYLATDSKGELTEAKGFGQETISKVEHEINILDEQLPPLTAFILPGGCNCAALANVCRTICRRAEREIITLSDNIWTDPNVIRFVNRLSDYFFALGRHFNIATGNGETTWTKDE